MMQKDARGGRGAARGEDGEGSRKLARFEGEQCFEDGLGGNLALANDQAAFASSAAALPNLSGGDRTGERQEGDGESDRNEQRQELGGQYQGQLEKGGSGEEPLDVGHETAGSKTQTMDVEAAFEDYAPKPSCVAGLDEEVWEEVPPPDLFLLEYSDDVETDLFALRFKTHRSMVVDNVKHRTKASGFSTVTPLSVFWILSDFLLSTMLEWTQRSMTARDILPVQQWEYISFLGILMNIDGDSRPRDVALQHVEAFCQLHQPSCSPVVLSLERFESILKHFRASGPGYVKSHEIGCKVFEAEFLRSTMEVAASTFMSLVLDKCEVSGKESGPAYLGIAESFLNLLFAVEHVEQGSIDSLDALAEPLVTRFAAMQRLVPATSAIVLVEQMCTSSQLIGTLAKLDTRFLAFCNPKDHPVNACSTESGGSPTTVPFQNSNLDMSDASDLGPEIRLWRCKSKDSSLAGKVNAFAYRDYSPEGDGKGILRYMECETRYTELLRSTISMVRLNAPEHTRNGLILFFPWDVSNTKRLAKETEVTLLQKCKPLSSWKGAADWFLLRLFTITETVSAMLARQDRHARELLFPNCQEDIEQEANESAYTYAMVENWIYATNKGKASPGVSVFNDPLIAKIIERQQWCLGYFDAGLFCSKEMAAVSAAPDAVVLVKGDGGSPVLSVCTLKTNLGTVEMRAADQIRLSHGSFFTCSVGDEVFYSCIPEDCRACLLHRAVVLNVDYALVVITDVGRLSYACLVHVSDDQKHSFQAVLSKWYYLVEWAYSPTVAYSSFEKAIPSAFSSQDRFVLHSHFRLWQSIQKRVASLGPVYPVASFESAIQTLHKALQGGIHGNEDFIKDLTGSKHRVYDKAQTVATRGVNQLVANSFVLYSVCMSSEAGQKWTSLTGFKDFFGAHAAQLCGFRYELASQLLQRAASLKLSSSTGPLASGISLDHESTSMAPQTPGYMGEHQQGQAEFLGSTPFTAINAGALKGSLSAEDIEKALQDMPSRFVALQDFFNREPGRSIRLSINHEHLPKKIGTRVSRGQTLPKQAKCLFCGGLTTSICSICKAPLHVSIVGNATTSCTQNWHGLLQIPSVANKSQPRGSRKPGLK